MLKAVLASPGPKINQTGRVESQSPPVEDRVVSPSLPSQLQKQMEPESHSNHPIPPLSLLQEVYVHVPNVHLRRPPPACGHGVVVIPTILPSWRLGEERVRRRVGWSQIGNVE